MSQLITQSVEPQGPPLDALTTQVVEMIKGLGVSFPTQIDPDDIVNFPVDITAISLIELGNLQSYWSAVYARDAGLLGIFTAQKRSLKYQISKLKPSATNNDKVKAALSDLEAQFARADAAEVIMDGIALGHKRYADACSREISRIRIEADLSR